MLSRRDFLTGASALTLTPLVERILNHLEHLEEPLLLRPSSPAQRILYMHLDHQGLGYQIVTDAVPYPRRLVAFDIIEKVFGTGSFRQMTQRDHWRMIDQGLFTRNQTFQPAFGDGFYSAWAANYAPHSEAIGLLEGLGLGPEPSDEGFCGLTFVNCGGDAEGLPAVYCDTTHAVSLLQAELIERGAPIEIRFEERDFPEVSWDDFLRNGGNPE